jgi:hypothetical protein
MQIPPQLAERLHPAFGSHVERARLHCGRFARLLTSLAGADAIVFGRRVFLGSAAEHELTSTDGARVELLAHELAHVRQYRRWSVAAFLGRYVGEYLRGRLAGDSHAQAYRAISFEREAEEASESVRDGREEERV